MRLTICRAFVSFAVFIGEVKPLSSHFLPASVNIALSPWRSHVVFLDSHVSHCERRHIFVQSHIQRILADLLPSPRRFSFKQLYVNDPMTLLQLPQFGPCLSGGPRIWDVGTSHRPLDLLNCRVRPIIAVGVLGSELVTDQNILALKLKGSHGSEMLRSKIRQVDMSSCDFQGATYTVTIEVFGEATHTRPASPRFRIQASPGNIAGERVRVPRPGCRGEETATGTKATRRGRFHLLVD